jgi:magnesium chelatase family protein
LATPKGRFQTVQRFCVSSPLAWKVPQALGSTHCYLHGCPCGHFSDPTRECRCTGGIIQRYLGKISGPLLDRIDLHIEVPAVPYQELRGKDNGATSGEMRARVERVRSVQQARGFYNAQIPVRQLRKLCALDDSGERTLEMAVRRMGLSARAHDRVLKVSRTIADLDSAERVTAKHLAEAVQYRSLDRNYWQ